MKDKKIKPKKFKKHPWMKNFSISKRSKEDKAFDLFLFRNCKGAR